MRQVQFEIDRELGHVLKVPPPTDRYRQVDNLKVTMSHSNRIAILMVAVAIGTTAVSGNDANFLFTANR